MTTKERTYVVLVSGAGLAALVAWYLGRRAADASTVEPQTVNTDTGQLEEITVTAQRLSAPDNRPRGIRNNNPGNLIYLPFNAYLGQSGADSEGYGVYQTAEFGLRAMALELKNDYVRKDEKTIDALITEWAPPGSNPTVAYINAVSRAMNTPPNRTLSLNRQTWFKLCRAIIRQENGADYYSDAEILSAIAAADIPV